MFTTFIILACIASILLILAVLIQNPKGGGIAANFSAANQIAGVKKTNEFIEKATWTLAIVLFVLSIGSRFVYTQSEAEKNAFLERVEESSINSVTAPNLEGTATNPDAQPAEGAPAEGAAPQDGEMQ